MDNVLIAGDFNSNKQWDKWDRWWNHSDVVRELADIDIRSLYHETHSEPQGGETFPTLYLQRNLLKPYHIDYAFASKKLITSCSPVIVGKSDDWLPFSDHMPLVIEW